MLDLSHCSLLDKKPLNWFVESLGKFVKQDIEETYMASAQYACCTLLGQYNQLELESNMHLRLAEIRRFFGQL